MANNDYVMGHDDRERRRLMLQASILNPVTEHLLQRAGIATGMHVLDIGCGVGDVSLLVSRLVGARGSVTSIDIDAAALDKLKARASAEGLGNIAYVHADVTEWKPSRKFDAVVGRHILIHTKDPLAVIKRCATMLQPRGLAVFNEYDFSTINYGWPPSPVRDRVLQVFEQFFTQATRANMGSRLYNLLMEAGFEQPDCRAEYTIGGRAENYYAEWITESFRSILPRAIALGIVAEGEFDIDKVERMVMEEMSASNSCSPAPCMIGAFARLRP